VDPLITLTAKARGSTHKNTISELKRACSLPKNIIEPMVSQLNIIAIKYAMNILLFKKKYHQNYLSTTTYNNKLKTLKTQKHKAFTMDPSALSSIMIFLSLHPHPYPPPFYRVHPLKRASSS
jgi:hypothetical protein